MYVIRKAQEHYRNVELHLYRKVGLLVRPSIRELSWKEKDQRTHLFVDQTCYIVNRDYTCQCEQALTRGRTQCITTIRGSRTLSYRNCADAGQCPTDTKDAGPYPTDKLNLCSRCLHTGTQQKKAIPTQTIWRSRTIRPVQNFDPGDISTSRKSPFSSSIWVRSDIHLTNLANGHPMIRLDYYFIILL